MASCPRLRPTTALQAGHSTLRQRKLESDADRCCGVARCHSGGFLLRIMPPSWHPVPACTPRLRCRRAVLRCRNDGAASILDFRPRLGNRCNNMVHSGYFCAAILDLRGSNWQSLQPLSSFRGLSCSDSRFQAQTCESMQPKGQNRSNPCIDSRFQAQTCESM